jgi:hypothetical protein
MVGYRNFSKLDAHDPAIITIKIKAANRDQKRAV